MLIFFIHTWVNLKVTVAYALFNAIFLSSFELPKDHESTGFSSVLKCWLNYFIWILVVLNDNKLNRFQIEPKVYRKIRHKCQIKDNDEHINVSLLKKNGFSGTTYSLLRSPETVLCLNFPSLIYLFTIHYLSKYCLTGLFNNCCS